MLKNYDHSAPLCVLGSGITARAIKEWIQLEHDIEVNLVDHTDFSKLTASDQCIPGFFNYRETFTEFVSNSPVINWVTFVSKSAFVVPSAMNNIGVGCVVAPLSSIWTEAVVGDFTTMNPYSLVGHGVIMGKNNVLAPRVTIGGSTEVGDNNFFGLNCSIVDRIKIGNNIKFLMNSVVTKSISAPGKYHGNKIVN